ncbi:MAG: hypothetical protein QNJ78_03565 [Gammaproteobacteria bacterium]|nr:hypothetical protein [Gammaproteobacteria bacterium]
MIRNKKKRYLISILFVWLSGSLSAGTFSERFKDFVIDEGVYDTSSESLTVQLPETGQSITCMGCHDGSKARVVELKHAASDMQFTGHGSVNHPVGMSYQIYANRDPVSFVSPGDLDSRIILEDGEVTCLSCHALKETPLQEEGKLLRTSVVLNQEAGSSVCHASSELTTGSNMTQLCLSCHDM